MTEQQIKEEVLRYLKDESYQYAILIDGEWGSGKTYFVNNILIKEIKKQEEKTEKPRSVKYISLYGCRRIEDIQENIAWSFAENARKKIVDKMKWRKTGNKISGNVILSSQKIGNIIMKKFLPDDSLYKISSDWLNLGAYIFVFDDLERCDCPINEVFGFINELVEHENTKVILVANEKELFGVADIDNLELQYQLSLDNRIQWPKRENNFLGYHSDSSNKSVISFNEMERRRGLLFPVKEANSDYKKIREKLIGVTLKYDPDIPHIISEIIDKSKIDSALKEKLRQKKNSFEASMGYYHHRNLRTFQFFLSKVSYLWEKLQKGDMEEEYFDRISEQIISETFKQSEKYKSNYKQQIEGYTWPVSEADEKFLSIKKYVETGTYEDDRFVQEIMDFQKELQSKIESDDPYYLIYDQYYLHTQEWCEMQLEELFKRLESNKYPITFYSKIVVTIQKLLDLGFDEKYMDRAKKLMLANITKMDEIKEIDSDLWYVEKSEFRDKVAAVILEINTAIRNHSFNISKVNVEDMLRQRDWIIRLDTYVKLNGNRYVQDIVVFSKASSSLWLNNLKKASPGDIEAFRTWLASLYPNNVIRKSYAVDAPVIREIIDGLEKVEENDLIKKAAIKWLCCQFEKIVDRHEAVKRE